MKIILHSSLFRLVSGASAPTIMIHEGGGGVQILRSQGYAFPSLPIPQVFEHALNGASSVRASVAFAGKDIDVSVQGVREQDEWHFRMRSARRVRAWIIHNGAAPPDCHARCENSHETGHPCVECRSDDAVVEVCC